MPADRMCEGVCAVCKCGTVWVWMSGPLFQMLSFSLSALLLTARPHCLTGLLGVAVITPWTKTDSGRKLHLTQGFPPPTSRVELTYLGMERECYEN